FANMLERVAPRVWTPTLPKGWGSLVHSELIEYLDRRRITSAPKPKARLQTSSVRSLLSAIRKFVFDYSSTSTDYSVPLSCYAHMDEDMRVLKTLNLS